jgi:hypothetical protein
MMKNPNMTVYFGSGKNFSFGSNVVLAAQCARAHALPLPGQWRNQCPRMDPEKKSVINWT